MGFHPLVLHSETHEKQLPLVMDRLEGRNRHQHVIDITTTNSVSTNSLSDDRVNHEGPHHIVDRPSSSRSEILLSQDSSFSTTRLNSGNSSLSDRGDAFGYTSPLHSGLWILVELIVTLAQIVASVVILSLSRYRSNEAPLFAWVVGYACGCLATLPILYWRLRHGRHGFRRHSAQSHQNSSEAVNSSSVSLVHEENESHNNSLAGTRSNQTRGRINVRVNGIVDHFKMALDCFFAVWFVVGNVWIFGAHSSPSVAPKLYRLCIVFLTFSCIGYALPFLLCATIFCCLPCIISVMGIREDFSKTRGATTESINALPTYKCKLFKNENAGDEVICLSSSKSGISTLEDRTISQEDAVCCICLAPYMDNDELRELPCSHLFHTSCVDKWLKINASCPLCKLEVTESKSNGASSNAPRESQ